MTKFEIMTDHFEFRFGKSRDSIPAFSADEIFAMYFEQDSTCPTREESFDALEDAQREFAAHYSDYGMTRSDHGNVFWLLTGRLAWIEENTYDEDGEFDQGGDVSDYSAEGYSPDEPAVVNSEGKTYDDDEWDAVVELMDDDIRERLHDELSPCSKQEFFAAYAAEHLKTFGEQWELDKANPVW